MGGSNSDIESVQLFFNLSTNNFCLNCQSTYIPNLQVNNISVYPATDDEPVNGNTDVKTFDMPGRSTVEYTAKVRIDYTITNNVFNSSDFIIINL